MEVGHRRYVWSPSGGAVYVRFSLGIYSMSHFFLQLYAADGSRDVLVKVSRGQGLVSIDMTPQAMQLGLLESCVVASVLLQSGRRLE
jgi:hypothetical protein